MKLSFFPLILIVLVASIRPANAQLLSFAFTETVSGGTITGKIVGLSSSGSSTPTEIVITSQPAGYPDTPTNLIASGYGFYGSSNNFTVSGGAIVAANVGIYKALSNGDYQGYGFDITATAFGFSNENGLVLLSGTGSTLMSSTNNSGFSGITYTAVPEPHRTALIFLLACLGLLVGRNVHAQFRVNRVLFPSRHPFTMEKN